MSRSLKAIYENGVFRPLEPVDLEERQEVTVMIPDAREAAANHEVSCYEIAERAGIIAVLNTLPSDLSTNRKHFEGFGKE